MERFCCIGDMISYYSGASEEVSARIGSAWKKFRELSGVLIKKQEFEGRFISLVLDQFCYTVVKRENVLLGVR